MHTLRHDLRYALRALRRSPGFTLVAVLTLALGIGANSAIFSVVNTVLLRPLGYRDADRLVAIFTTERGGSETRNPTSPADFLDWKAQSRTLEKLTAAHPWSPTLRGDGAPERIGGLKATAPLFDLLGVEPALGRVFRERDEGSSSDRVVVIGYGLWQRRFGGDPDVLGRTLDLDGEPHEVIAVMPRGFEFPPFWATGAELWVPLRFSPEEAAERDARFLRVFGRLRPGASAGEARAELTGIAARLAAAYPEESGGSGLNLEPLSEPVVGGVRPALLVLLAAVGLVLLIAMSNVAHLLLGRVAAREKESAIRTALGASRAEIARQWLVESAVLALAGGACGVALAWLGVEGLVALSPEAIPRLDEVTIDGEVLLFTLGLSLATIFLFGAGPALRAARAAPGVALRTREERSHAARKARYALVGGEIALAVVLLTGAGLMVRSFAELQRVDAGFATENRLTATLSLTGSAHADPARQTELFESLSAALAAQPGVRAAGVVNHLPIGGDTWRSSLEVEGRAPVEDEEASASYRAATSGYFAAMGIPLVRGRLFDGRDTPDGGRVAVVNETLAARYWPGGEPVGRRVRLGGPEDPWLTVVGVVGDVRQQSLTEPALPEVYLPFSQNPVAWYEGGAVVVHHSGDASAAAAAIRREVAALDPGVPVSELRGLDEVLAGQLREERVNTWLLGVFAATAVTLALVGLYGVVSYLVGQRTREIGVRVALGATAGEIARMVLRESLAVTAAAVVAGLLLAQAATGLLRGMLYGVGTGDPLTFAGAAALVAAVALLASAIPALRASRVDPMVALRGE